MHSSDLQMNTLYLPAFVQNEFSYKSKQEELSDLWSFSGELKAKCISNVITFLWVFFYVVYSWIH